MLHYTYTVTSLQHSVHFMHDYLPFQLVGSIKTCLTRNLLHTWSVCTIPHCGVVAINKSGRSYNMNTLLLMDNTKLPTEGTQHYDQPSTTFYRKNCILKTVSENQKQAEVFEECGSVFLPQLSACIRIFSVMSSFCHVAPSDSTTFFHTIS
jgi:hypothetical protein